MPRVLFPTLLPVLGARCGSRGRRPGPAETGGERQRSPRAFRAVPGGGAASPPAARRVLVAFPWKAASPSSTRVPLSPGRVRVCVYLCLYVCVSRSAPCPAPVVSPGACGCPGRAQVQPGAGVTGVPAYREVPMYHRSTGGIPEEKNIGGCLGVRGTWGRYLGIPGSRYQGVAVGESGVYRGIAGDDTGGSCAEISGVPGGIPGKIPGRSRGDMGVMP